jgi:hypothetical protein
MNVIGQRLKAMGKAFGYEQRASVLGGQMFGVPMRERRRTGAHIDGDIPHLAVQASYQLHFRVGRALEVHAAYSAEPGGVGVIDLDDRLIPADGAQFAGAKQPFEKAARIAQALPLDQLQASQWQIGDCKSIQPDAS